MEFKVWNFWCTNSLNMQKECIIEKLHRFQIFLHQNKLMVFIWEAQKEAGTIIMVGPESKLGDWNTVQNGGVSGKIPIIWALTCFPVSALA